MNYLTPPQVCALVYLDGTQPRFRFIPRTGKAAGKPVPLSTRNDPLVDTVGFIGPKGYFFLPDTLPYLKAANSVPPDAPPDALRADRLPWTLQMQDLASQVNAEQLGLKGVASVYLYRRNETMTRLYDALRAKGRAREEAIAEVATRFLCPDRLVVQAINRINPRGKPPTRVAPCANEPRYKLLSAAAQRARALACNSGRGGTFTILDLLIDRKTIPTHCPVLGVPLDYEPADPRRSLNAAVVGRLDPDKPYDSGNVAVMTKLASRLISGAIASTRAYEALSGETNERWLEWAKTHPTKFKRRE